jgi:hypothetical protein
MTSSKKPLSGSSDNGPGADNTGCNCIQCRLTSLFRRISALHVPECESDALLDVLNSFYGIIQQTGRVYRLESCPELQGIIGQLESISIELDDMAVGGRLKAVVKRLQEITQ